jgi:hypothetical protein
MFLQLRKILPSCCAVASVVGGVLLLSSISSAHHSLELQQEVGSDIVYLDVPAEGIVASQEATFTVHVVKDHGATGGQEPEICKSLRVVITMPEMQGMPPIVPDLEPMGDPGLLLFKASFPHGGKYRFSIAANNGGTINTSFDEVVQDPISAAGGGASPYALQMQSVPAVPHVGQVVLLTLRIVDNASGKVVTNFDVVHEKKMHLFLVRSDLSRFFHVHPDPNSDGSFSYRFSFPAGGTWRVFADSAPHNMGSRITSATLKVSGTSDPDSPPLVSAATSQLSVVDGMTLTLTPGPLEAHNTRELTFTLTDQNGQPVTNIQPWLGADAHMMAIDRSGTLFVHSHPSERSAVEIAAGKLTFVTHMPESGLYKAWIQLQQGGKIHTFVFLINVS